MTVLDNTACIILAGGRGKRMASADRHKVCFPIDGRPAIVRAIDTYKAAGLRHFLVVVGQMAEQVIATVSAAHPEATFVFQADPRGTGHAAKVAVDALAAQGYRGDVLIVMGDKMTRPQVVRDLVTRFRDQQVDLLLATQPIDSQSDLGRVITDPRGRVLGIVEMPDLQAARKNRRKVPLGGDEYTAAQLTRLCTSVNGSMYCFRFDPLHQALGRLRAANAQGELYLTDTVEMVAAGGRAAAHFIEDPEDLMAFNTPAELLAIEQVVRRRASETPVRVSARSGEALTAASLKPAADWLAIVTGDAPAWRGALREAYGDDADLTAERRKALTEVVRAFIKRHGPDRPMVLVRAPGRLNLMGRHVDHRGGYVNVMAISREVLLAAAPRTDDVVTLTNVDPKRFGPREFRIYDLLHEASWTDWIDFVNSQAVRHFLAQALGDWSHYARAPLLRLQHECRDVRLRGMDCVVTGNIPTGAGLSSSSALVVAFAEAALALNGLDVAINDFIDICGEGEWFVGTRGGSADHAAIRTSKIGQISRIGFFPFHLAGEETFPADLKVVVAYSGATANKSAGARDIFNQRVLCYELAELFLRRYWPAAADTKHLRDMTPERLGVGVAELYRALAQLPERPSVAEFRQLMPRADDERLDRILATHGSSGRHDLRGVALYGLSEIGRSEQFAAVIGAGDLERVAQLIRLSHDGDRCFRYDAAGKRHRHVVHTHDTALRRLAETEADLATQCGRYACSTEAIDHLVDIAGATDGVIGAQLAGAGLGGCMMILIRRDGLTGLLDRLRDQFYTPRELAMTAYVCTPVAGAGLLSV
ncbi:MAG: NTP transferase domain-containing protein [Planctomycetes bacterium]|nr:NTP transferase domain-containing protein [Planctomycetota bacterium]